MTQPLPEYPELLNHFKPIEPEPEPEPEPEAEVG